jgi:hypothetical protein
VAEAQLRYVVIVSRVDFELVPDITFDVEDVIIGPFRRLERAEARAATVRRLAEQYDEPDGTLHVAVVPLRAGTLSAQDAMDYLYGGLVDA